MSRTPATAIPRVEMLQYPRDGVFRPAEFSGVDVVCHLAAFIPPRNDDSSFAEECFRVNVLHTLSLLTAAAGKVKQLIYLSAGNAYALSDGARIESDSLYPDSRATHYLLSKVAGEVYVSASDRRGELRALVLRPSSVYGPGMPRRSMLAQFIARARAGKTIELSDGGAFGADLVYVDDVVKAIIAGIELDASGIFNVGSGQRTTSRQAAIEVFHAVGAAEPDISITGTAPTSFSGFAALNVSRARCELGYEPLHLRDGLARWLSEAER
jgi:UDP-glucose 4-epimerase